MYNIKPRKDEREREGGGGFSIYKKHKTFLYPQNYNFPPYFKPFFVRHYINYQEHSPSL